MPTFIDWFATSLPGFNLWLASEVQRMDLASLVVAPTFAVTPEMLEADKVHLVPAAGDQFLTQLNQHLQVFVSSLNDVTLVENDPGEVSGLRHRHGVHRRWRQARRHPEDREKQFQNPRRYQAFEGYCCPLGRTFQ